MQLSGAVISRILEKPASITGRIGKEVRSATTVPETAVLTHACLIMNYAHSCL